MNIQESIVELATSKRKFELCLKVINKREKEGVLNFSDVDIKEMKITLRKINKDLNKLCDLQIRQDAIRR